MRTSAAATRHRFRRFRGRPWEPLVLALLVGPLFVGAAMTRPFQVRREPVVRTPPASELLQRGLRAFEAKKPGEALISWQQLMVLEPTWPASHNNVGMALMASGRAREAREHFVRAIALSPSEQLFKNNLAWCDRELEAEGKKTRGP